MDFTSALYLGMKHTTGSLPPWRSFTTGKPAALKEPVAAGQAAKAVARLQGMEEGLLYPSTLHLFWDLFEYLGNHPIAIFLDREAYPIAGWGVERAAKKGVPVYQFQHNNAKGLLKTLSSNRANGLRPVVVTDAWCPACGAVAPLLKYLDILRPLGGWLVLDDTQAMGILGKRPSASMPYGLGGGGTLPWLGVRDENILVGSSLAKAFGVPVAVLSGQSKILDQIASQSLTRVHCSPLSLAVISATIHALSVNDQQGEQRRRILLQQVKRFKNGLWEAGIGTSKSLFPVQHLTSVQGIAAQTLNQRLERQGIQSVLTTGHRNKAQVTFLLRADHRPQEIDEAVRMIARNLKSLRPTQTFTAGQPSVL